MRKHASLLTGLDTSFSFPIPGMNPVKMAAMHSLLWSCVYKGMIASKCICGFKKVLLLSYYGAFPV